MPLRGELDALLRASPILTGGIVLDDWGPGSARTRLQTRKEPGNIAGSISGATLLTLADAAFEAACNGYGRRCVALELSCHFTSPGQPGEELAAEASELNRTRRTASYRIEVLGAERALRAVCIALAYRTDRWHLGEERWPEAWRQAH